MVFSFFKKQPNKMPERPAAKPRPVAPAPEIRPQQSEPEAQAKPLPEPLPDLEFTTSKVIPQAPVPPKPQTPPPAAASAPVQVPADDFSIDDFDSDFTNSSVMGIDVEHDVQPAAVLR